MTVSPCLPFFVRDRRSGFIPYSFSHAMLFMSDYGVERMRFVDSREEASIRCTTHFGFGFGYGAETDGKKLSFGVVSVEIHSTVLVTDVYFRTCILLKRVEEFIRPVSTCAVLSSSNV